MTSEELTTCWVTGNETMPSDSQRIQQLHYMLKLLARGCGEKLR